MRLRGDKGQTIKKVFLPVAIKEAGFYSKPNEKSMESLEAEGRHYLMNICKRSTLPTVWGMN